MNSEIDILKKKQRELLSKKRIFLRKSINLNDVLFYEILNKYNWFIESNIVASFMSIKSEIPTKNLNKFLQVSKKILCLPVITNHIKEILIFKKYVQNDNLIIGKFGIKEPRDTKVFLPDIIFVPCLAFDKYGFRLGYGGGYYDKTISYFRSIGHSFLTIGLAYDDQKVEKVIKDNFDQKLNYILTEKQLYEIL